MPPFAFGKFGSRLHQIAGLVLAYLGCRRPAVHDRHARRRGAAAALRARRVVVTIAERAGLSKEDVAGVYSSINLFFGHMTSMIGPIFGGFLVEQFGFPWATTVLGFISLAIAGPSGIALWWRYTEPPDKQWPCFEQAEAAENLPGLEEAPAPSPAGAPAMSGVRWPTGAPAGEGEKEQ